MSAKGPSTIIWDVNECQRVTGGKYVGPWPVEDYPNIVAVLNSTEYARQRWPERGAKAWPSETGKLPCGDLTTAALVNDDGSLLCCVERKAEDILQHLLGGAKHADEREHREHQIEQMLKCRYECLVIMEAGPNTMKALVDQWNERAMRPISFAAIFAIVTEFNWKYRGHIRWITGPSKTHCANTAISWLRRAEEQARKDAR